MLFLDGAYIFRGQRPTFRRARRPTGDELTRLLDRLSRRIVRVLERRGLLIADPECLQLDIEPNSSLDHLQAASINYRIAIGPHAGPKALTLYSVLPILRNTVTGLTGVDPAIVEKERQVQIDIARESGKPDNVIEKMIEGRMKKFIAESTLLSQAFVVNPDLTVEKATEEAGVAIGGFARFEVGDL